jgi:hypothetical protein
MSTIERVLEPNSTETPTCICGKDMRLTKVQQHAIAEDAETRQFDCDCGHRMMLAVWKD